MMIKSPWDLTDDEWRAVIIDAGQNPDLPPRVVSTGEPPPGLRNWVCAADWHEDPDYTGVCIHCCKDLELLYSDEVQNETV